MALLRSAAARALRLRQPQGFPVPRSPADGSTPRLLSSAVPTERDKGFVSSDPRSRNTAEQNRNSNKKEEILQLLSAKVDKICDGLDKNTQLIQELECQIKDNNKSRDIDITPGVLLVSVSLVSFVLYKSMLC